ncbi:hypothetical protein [Bradyrhizobium sp. LA2.1]|uniref:hypothetical protein n=1 Tax=Bradyrhizobium sp. LA2.1 TaxID=3156376 RepID=UPI003395322D
MFNVTAKRTFTHDVKVSMPVDGGFSDEVLKTTFNYIPSDEMQQVAQTDDAFLQAVVNTFHDLVDDGKNPVACTAELRAAILRNSNVQQALITHYTSAIRKVPQGN